MSAEDIALLTLVLVLRLQDVEEVQAGRVHVDEHLAARRLGRGNVRAAVSYRFFQQAYTFCTWGWPWVVI